MSMNGLDGYVGPDGKLPKELPEGENEELVKRFQQGDKTALDKLVRHNLRLVAKVTSRFKGRWDDEDVVQAALMGLMRAAEKFDPSYGAKFTSYAYFWIRQTAAREIWQHSKGIRIPATKFSQLGMYHTKKWELYSELQREPTDEELAEAMEMTTEQVRELVTYELEIKSYDVSLDDDWAPQEIPIERDQLEAHYTDSIEVFLDVHRMLQRVLSSDEYKVLCHRWGLDGKRQLNFPETIEATGLTVAKVRDRERSAFHKVSHPAVALKMAPGGF